MYKKTIKTKKTRLIKASSLNILLSLIVLYTLFLGITPVYAWEFDNTLSADKSKLSIGKYPELTIKNAFGIGSDLVTMKILENTEECLINCRSVIEIKLYEDNTLPESIYFNEKERKSDVKVYYQIEKKEEIQTPVYKKTCKSVYDSKNNSNYEDCKDEVNYYTKEDKITNSWVEYKGETMKAGVYIIKIEGKKGKLESIDWSFDYLGISKDDIKKEWAWWNGNWAKKQKVTIQGGASTLNDFTIYVNVTYDGSMQPDFEDIRFVDSTETTELNYDLDYKVDSNSASFWVKIPTLNPGNNEIYMYFGNNAATTGKNPTQAWDDYYIFVFHCNNYTENSTALLDSKGTANFTLSAPKYAAGVFGQGINLSYSDSVQRHAAGLATPLLNDQISIEFNYWWDDTETERYFAGKYASSGLGSAFHRSGTTLYWDGTSDPGGNQARKYYSNFVNAGKFISVFATYGGSAATINLKVNKSEYGTTSNSGSPGDIYETNTIWRIGSVDGASQFVSSVMDEIRISNISRESAWINRSLDNEDISLFSFGATQNAGGLDVNLNIPEDNYKTNNTLVTFNFSFTLTNLNLTNYTFTIYYNNGSKFYNLFDDTAGVNASKNVTLTIDVFADGVYRWNAYGRATDGATSVYTAGTNRTFYIDRVEPVINITYPFGYYITLNNAKLSNYNTTLNFSISHATTTLSSCWINYSSGNAFFPCENNYTNINNSLYGQSYTLNIFANDSAGNTNHTATTFQKDYYTYNHKAQNTAGVGQLITFELYLNSSAISTDYPQSSGYLNFNGTYYKGDADLSNANYIRLYKDIVVPINAGNITGVNQTYYWVYNITNGGLKDRQTTDYKAMKIYGLSIDNCTNLQGYNFINFTILDEEAGAELVNTDLLKIDINISSRYNASVSSFYNGTFLNYSTISLCIPNNLLNDSTYRIDITAEYSADSYSKEFYFLDNGTLQKTCSFNSYTSCNINLYDLLAADTTSFLFSYTDNNGLNVPNAIVNTYRKYIGEGLFKEVQRSKQDENGETNLYLVEEEVIYYFMVTLDGKILFTSAETTAKCLSTPCEITYTGQADTTPFPNDWDGSTNTDYSFIVNKTSRMARLTYNSEIPALINLTIYQSKASGDILINKTSSSASSGTISLFIPVIYGNNTFYARVFENNNLLTTYSFDLTPRNSETFGALGLFFAAFIILLIGLLAASDGLIAIIITIASLFIMGVIGLISINYYFIGYIITIGGIIIWKISRNKRQ